MITQEHGNLVLRQPGAEELGTITLSLPDAVALAKTLLHWGSQRPTLSLPAGSSQDLKEIVAQSVGGAHVQPEAIGARILLTLGSHPDLSPTFALPPEVARYISRALADQLDAQAASGQTRQ